MDRRIVRSMYPPRAILNFLAGRANELPPELIRVILSKLPLEDILTFRYVSHSWRDLMKGPSFAKLHYLNSCRNPKPIGLILYSRSRTSLDLYVIPDIDRCDITIKLNNLPFKSWIPIFKVMGSCNGFICVADDTSTYRGIIISNPVIGDWNLMPDVPEYGLIHGKFFGFGYIPSEKKYKVVRVRPTGDVEKLNVDTHDIGNDYWEFTQIPNERIIGSMGNSYGVFLNGKMHWFYIFRDKGIIDQIAAFDDERTDFTMYSGPNSLKFINCRRVYLGDLGGFLTVALNCALEHNLEVWQMKDYGVDVWTLTYLIRRPMCCCSSTSSQLQPLAMQTNGNVLLDYRCFHQHEFYSYDPKTNRLEEVITNGLPRTYEAFPHMATLLPLKDALVANKDL